MEKRVSDSNEALRDLKAYVDGVIKEQPSGQHSELCCGYKKKTMWSESHKDMVTHLVLKSVSARNMKSDFVDQIKLNCQFFVRGQSLRYLV